MPGHWVSTWVLHLHLTEEEPQRRPKMHTLLSPESVKPPVTGFGVCRVSWFTARSSFKRSEYLTRTEYHHGADLLPTGEAS